MTWRSHLDENATLEGLGTRQASERRVDVVAEELVAQDGLQIVRHGLLLLDAAVVLYTQYHRVPATTSTINIWVLPWLA